MDLSQQAVVQSAASAVGSLTSGPTTSEGRVNHQARTVLTVGTTTKKSDAVYSARRTVDSGSPVTIDLNALTDINGVAINFAYVHAIIISNRSVTAGQDLTIGGTLNANVKGFLEAGDASVEGGSMCITAPVNGFTVTNTSADTITVTAAAGTGVPFDITIIGRKA